MSKDIWHTADVKPKSLKTFVYKTDEGHIGTSMLAIDSGWNPVLLPEFYNMEDIDKAERITKWCYLDDLLELETKNKDLSDKIGKLETELERTRKALDVALDWFGQVATPEKCDDDLCREFTKRKLAEIKIALEQKDVK